MILKNLDQFEELCNGTRMIITRLVNHVIGAKIISENSNRNEIYITHMSMSPSQSPWRFKLIRRQFSIIVSYAMTINKSQSQSLSRVQSKQRLHNKENKLLMSTTDVVFKEVF
uniref:DNA helicase Pif1-like 2B domain-containing protein n=1 Tax=Cajanus cajan TaxID=3821 RepID=A0A151U972_CAJCA|nr:hypothetical protein KK1_020029 [Cajanus cajan]